MTKILDCELKIRLARKERELWEERAHSCGLSISNWMRVVLNAACGEPALTDSISEAQKVARSDAGRQNVAERKDRGQ